MEENIADGFVVQNQRGHFWIGGYNECARWTTDINKCLGYGTFFKSLNHCPPQLFLGEKIVAVRLTEELSLK
jgi:hypothetical protein